MNLAQSMSKPSKTHTVKRTNKCGSVREYDYKLLRIKRIDGRITTVSCNTLEYVSLTGKYKPSQRMLSSTAGEAYRHLERTNGWRKGLGRSVQTVALTGKMFEAQRKGVALEDFLHAEANNDAWS